MKFGLREKIIVALFGLATAISVAAIITLSVYQINLPDPHEHTYFSQTVDPTCTQTGYILYTCDCGESYKEEGGVPALGHDYAEAFTVDVQPNCTEKGSKSKHCSRCESTDEVMEIPANGHDLGEWQLTVEPKCATRGTETRDCKNCTFGEGRSIDPLGHNYGEWETVSEQSCDTYGVKLRSCSRCGGEDKVINDVLGHDVEYTTDVYYHNGICNRCKTYQRSKHAFVGTKCVYCEYEVHPTQGLEYTLNDDGASYSVTGIEKATDATELVIFSTHNGLPVTAVERLNYNDAKNVTSIVIYDNVKELKGSAFFNYKKLQSVYLPSTLTDINAYAFTHCSSLKEIVVDSANPVYHSVDGKFIIETNTKTLYLGVTNEIPADSSVTSIGDYAFAGRFSYKGIVIPDTITSIGNYAFEYCRYFDSIEIPSSVKSIGDGAFQCTDIKSVILNDGLMSIGADAFRADTELKEIFIPKSVTRIGDNAFGECRKLKTFTVDSQNPVYHSAGNCLIETQTKTLVAGCSASVIPDDGSVTSIGDYAFFGYYFVSIELPDSVTSIGICAFAHNSYLNTIIIPENLTLIDERAFLSCSKLKEIKYSGAVTQWIVIEKKSYFGDRWDKYLPSDYRIICKNGIITANGVEPIS